MQTVRQFSILNWRDLWHGLWGDARGQELLDYAVICSLVLAAALACAGSVDTISGRFSEILQFLMTSLARVYAGV